MLGITFRSRAPLLFLWLIIAPLLVIVCPTTAAANKLAVPQRLLDRVLIEVIEVIKEETRNEPEPAPANPQTETDQPAPSQNETDSGAFNMDNLMKVVVKDGVFEEDAPLEPPLRAEPSPAGKELDRVIFGTFNTNDILYVDPTLIPSNDGSPAKWYKVIFLTGLWCGDFMRVDHCYTNYSFVYIDASHVREEKLDVWDREKIEYFKQGRPPRFAVGDSLAKVKKMNAERTMKMGYGHYPENHYREAKTISPITLYKEPIENAATFTLPKGSKIIMTIQLAHDM